MHLGQTIYGVNLKAANAKLAITKGILMQQTITAAGRVSNVLRIDASKPVEVFDSSLCFETDKAAKEFYIANSAEYKSIETDILKPAYKRADEKRNAILGKPLFPELADK